MLLNKKLMVYIAHYKDAGNHVFIPDDAKTKLVQLMIRATDLTDSINVLYLSNAEGPLRASLATLVTDHAGGPEGTDWHKLVSKSTDWVDFLAMTETNIRRLKKVDLVTKVLETDKVRCVNYNSPPGLPRAFRSLRIVP